MDREVQFLASLRVNKKQNTILLIFYQTIKIKKIFQKISKIQDKFLLCYVRDKVQMLNKTDSFKCIISEYLIIIPYYPLITFVTYRTVQEIRSLNKIRTLIIQTVAIFPKTLFSINNFDVSTERYRSFMLEKLRVQNKRHYRDSLLLIIYEVAQLLLFLPTFSSVSVQFRSTVRLLSKTKTGHRDFNVLISRLTFCQKLFCLLQNNFELHQLYFTQKQREH